MTHDERIEAMAKALYMTATHRVSLGEEWRAFLPDARAAWASVLPDVEEMVREAVRKTADAAFVALGETTETRIVNEVMGK